LTSSTATTSPPDFCTGTRTAAAARCQQQPVQPPQHMAPALPMQGNALLPTILQRYITSIMWPADGCCKNQTGNSLWARTLTKRKGRRSLISMGRLPYGILHTVVTLWLFLFCRRCAA
jgi:hypothetical protein